MKQLQLSAGLLFIASMALAYGAFSKNWISSGGNGSSITAGLRELEFCMDDEPCKTMSFEQIGTSPSTNDRVMVWSGKFSFGIGLAGALVGLICGGMFLTQRKNTGAIVALGVGVAALAGGITFLITISPDSTDFSRGAPSYAYLAGASCMIVAASLALRCKAAIPSAVPLLAGTSATGTGVAVPACPQCAAPTTWMAEHNRFFCARCRVYL